MICELCGGKTKKTYDFFKKGYNVPLNLPFPLPGNNCKGYPRYVNSQNGKSAVISIANLMTGQFALKVTKNCHHLSYTIMYNPIHSIPIQGMGIIYPKLLSSVISDSYVMINMIGMITAVCKGMNNKLTHQQRRMKMKKFKRVELGVLGSKESTERIIRLVFNKYRVKVEYVMSHLDNCNYIYYLSTTEKLTKPHLNNLKCYITGIIDCINSY